MMPNPEGLRTRHLVAGTQHPLVVAPNLAEKKRLKKGVDIIRAYGIVVAR
jgi:hypothetical protein